jgi:hypothetical protein
MTAIGHEDQFQPPRLNGRCRFGQGTFAGTHGNGQDAPRADLVDKAPHLLKHTVGDMETPCPPVAGIFCLTLAAERFTAAVRRAL